MPPEPVNVTFWDSEGNPVLATDASPVTLRLYPESDRATAVEISEAEANEHGEARVQLTENKGYWYKLSAPGFRLRELSEVVRPSRIENEYDQGRITPGLNVGRIRFVLLSALDDSPAGTAEVEVCAGKVTYREEYRHMLQYITKRCTDLVDLLLELRSPAEQTLLSQDPREPGTDCQRFAFVRSIITSREFRNAVHRVIGMPHRLWEQEEEQVSLDRGVKPSACIARQIASASRRVSLPDNHPLKSRMVSVPDRVTILRNVETVDTAENRFVKHALRTFRSFAANVKERLQERDREKNTRFIEEAEALEEELGETLNRDFFRAISDPELLPLNSPVLQRKGGYREILAAWLQFDMAARLHWKGGENVYGAGKRDVATLYEYWLFFKLLEVVASIFRLNEPQAKSLIEPTEDGFGLKLQSGRHIPLEGEYTAGEGGRRIRVRFSYNRTFQRNGKDAERNFPDAGSWTERMRPDYTLTLWPANFTEEDAESQEVIVHVHFDAKYRVKDLPEMFGTADEDLPDQTALDKDLTEDKAAQQQGCYHRADLLKMHAYKDAIRRTVGAYVLYPGAQNRNWQGFHEIVPGLGAFGVRPCEDGDDGTAALEVFIRQVVKHVCDRATQRDRESYHRYDIHRTEPSTTSVREIPEVYAGRTERHPPAADTTIIEGYIRPAVCKTCHDEGIFFFHAVDENGQPARVNPGVLRADYLVPYTDNGKWLGWYAPIERCELVTLRELIRVVPPAQLRNQRPYYYLVRLNKKTIRDFETHPPAKPPNPGAPKLCRWTDLYRE